MKEILTHFHPITFVIAWGILFSVYLLTGV
jgi:hypothetical protein